MLTRLGYGAECATWRNNFLAGAQELGGAIAETAVSAAGMAGALTITLTRPQLLAMLAGADGNGIQLDGDPKVFSTIVGLTDQPDPNFPIVTP